MAALHELHYRFDGAAGGSMPGHHRSRGGSSGFEFRGHAPLQQAPDPRRLDLHASLRDPFGQWLMRLYSERRSIVVTLLADLSASMAFEGAQRKLDVLADFADSLAWSAWRTGDSFGFIGGSDRLHDELRLLPTRRRGAGSALATALRGLQPAGRSARALLDAHRLLPARRGLVFVVSDFHWPLADVDTLLGGLAAHQVVPVVLWQPAEFGLGAAHGLAPVLEPESGRRQWLWWRPALRQRWQAAHDERRAALLQIFRRHRVAPLFVEGAFDADAVTRHFAA